jgi:hypothetical protein
MDPGPALVHHPTLYVAVADYDWGRGNIEETYFEVSEDTAIRGTGGTGTKPQPTHGPFSSSKLYCCEPTADLAGVKAGFAGVKVKVDHLLNHLNVDATDDELAN